MNHAGDALVIAIHTNRIGVQCRRNVRSAEYFVTCFIGPPFDKSGGDDRTWELICVSDPDNKSDTENSGGFNACKMTWRYFPVRKNRDVKRNHEFVHSDLSNPMSQPSLGGKRCFLVVVDYTIGKILFNLNNSNYSRK